MAAQVESFLTSSDFSLVTSDVELRFSELAQASGDNLSTHILIDGLVPVEDGSDILTSSYRGVDIATGNEFDVGQVVLTLPDGAGSDGASSPIVGIVARNTPSSGTSGWSQYTVAELTGTQIGGSTGSVDIDTTTSGTMTFALTSSAGALTGSADYTVVDASTIEVAAFDLTDPSGTFSFGPMDLIKSGDNYYGVMVSESAALPADYDSLMYTLRLGSDTSVWGGYNVVTTEDGTRWADTGSNWMGYISLKYEPMYYNYEMNVFMYMPGEPLPDAVGAWCYVFKNSTLAPVGGDEWGGYSVVLDDNGFRWIEAPNWMGWLNVEYSPMLFGLTSNVWMYTPSEPDDGSVGAWFYVFKR